MIIYPPVQTKVMIITIYIERREYLTALYTHKYEPAKYLYVYSSIFTCTTQLLIMLDQHLETATCYQWWYLVV